MRLQLDFLKFKNVLRIRRTMSDKLDIYDIVRRKYMVLQPEELVRQLVVHYLINEKNYPLSKMRVEMGLTVNERQKRCDILVFDNQFQPFLLVECKAATVQIDQTTFEQIARYNLVFRVPYLLVTNGITTYCCQMDYITEEVTFLDNLPDF
ncbi:MAG: type I restriction enzyme HsdR N-terminal domain-containing protein [Saprospiraceae bacterium]|nr:type I restriction enzyme HsdR N-terminal domain-containing protein [Saprospiraceae bacterium]